MLGTKDKRASAGVLTIDLLEKAGKELLKGDPPLTFHVLTVQQQKDFMEDMLRTQRLSEELIEEQMILWYGQEWGADASD